MKHIKKFNEDLNIINSKDLDSWSVPKANEPKKSGSKTLDRELGQKVLDLFEENGLVIDLNNKQGRQPSLPGEDNFVEWRCEISKRKSFEDWYDYEYSDDLTKLNKKELKEKQKEYSDTYSSDELDNCEFSVFLPKGVKDIQSALSDASTYLKQLNNSATSVLKGYIEKYDMITDNVDELKKFLKLRQIMINNDNLEILTDIAYRLYHDCKFITNVYSEFGEEEGKQLFKDWLEILGEKSNF